nr:sodefrin precursor-like factor alpha 3 [Eurycea tynerensis]
MRAFLAGICFLLAFIATGHSLECVVCHSYSEINCIGDLVTCPHNSTVCQTAVADIRYEGKVTANQVFKSCSENAQYDHYKEQMIGVSYDLIVKPCHEDGCNNEPIDFPPRNNTLNGVTCPTCYVEGASSCESNNVTVQCTGDRTKCIYVAATARISEEHPFDCAYRGCTNIKDVRQFPDFPGQTLNNVKTLQLTDGV